MVNNESKVEENRDLRILYIDDEQPVRQTLSTFLERSGFQVIQAENGEEGLEKFHTCRPSVVLVDLRMPGMGGLKVLEKVIHSSPETPVIIVSGAGMMRDVIEALRLGAWDFITKPVQDLAILEHTVRKGIERAGLMREKREHRAFLEKEIKRRTEELRRELTERIAAQEALKKSIDTLQEVMAGTIHAFGQMAEIRDPYTAGHQRRVSRLACRIAVELGMSREECDGIDVAGVLHDIGKIHIPAEILNKPGKLTVIEMSLIKTHPSIGYEILKTVPFPWPVAEIVLQHHEKIDGSGYPNGNRGQKIHMAAQIIGVADVVEAMSSHRPYRPALGMKAAIEEILKSRGMQYTTEVVDACLNVLENKGFEFETDES
jgi:putative two-component system response regulator